MSETILNVDTFIKEIMTSIVIKSGKFADMYETAEYSSDYALYRAALTKADVISSYTFSEDEIKALGIYNETDINRVKSDSSQIYIYITPTVLAELLETKRAERVASYVEQNLYIRTICGLPDISNADNPTSEYITISQALSGDNLTLALKLGIHGDTYVHELTTDDINSLKDNKLLSTIQGTYNYSYLYYLDRRVNLIKAREANNCDILFVECSSVAYLESFKTSYEICKMYFKTVLMNVFMTQQVYFYEFMTHMYLLYSALSIAVMEYSNSKLDFDYMNKNILKYLFESHGLKYVDIPELQTRRLFENIVDLKRYKGSKRALTIIKNIFDINNIYKYVLHKIPYTNNEGELEFNMCFYKVPYTEYRLNRYVGKSEFAVPYINLISNDPYWSKDGDVYNELIKSELSTIETKFLSLDLLNDLFEYTMDYTALIYTILKYKDVMNDTSLFTISYRRGTTSNMSVYDGFILMMCLYHQISGVPSDINYHINSDKKILACNIEMSASQIKGHIRNMESNFDSNLSYIIKINSLLKKSLYNMDVVGGVLVNALHVLRIVDVIEDNINSVDLNDQYDTLNNLYNDLTINETLPEAYFTDSDGVVHTDFVTYLSKINRPLYDRYMYLITEDVTDDIRKKHIIEEFTYVVDILMKGINPTSDDDLGAMLNPLQKMRDYNNSSLNDSIKELILSFVSYTVDLIDLSGTLVVDAPFEDATSTHIFAIEYNYQINEVEEEMTEYSVHGYTKVIEEIEECEEDEFIIKSGGII